MVRWRGSRSIPRFCDGMKFLGLRCKDNECVCMCMYNYQVFNNLQTTSKEI